MDHDHLLSTAQGSKHATHAQPPDDTHNPRPVRTPSRAGGTYFEIDAAETQRALHTAEFRGEVLKAVREALATQDISLAGKAYLRQAIKSPARNPAGRMTGRFASQKMGVTLGVDHGALGLAALRTLETSARCIGYFDLPPPIKHRFQFDGRPRSFLQKPSLVYVEDQRVVLVTLVPEATLRRRQSKDDSIYVRVNGGWSCPSADNAAKELGFEHQVWTEATFSRQLVCNLTILADFYTETEPSEEQLSRIQALTSKARELGRAPLIGELLAATRHIAGVEDVFYCLSNELLFFNGTEDDLTHYEQVRVFCDAPTQVAFAHAEQATSKSADMQSPAQRPLEVGDKLVWDGVVFEVKNVGKTCCAISSGGSIQEYEHRTLHELRRDGLISLLEGGLSLIEARRNDMLDMALQISPKNLRTANLRLGRIEPFLTGLKANPNRTERRYIASFKAAERRCGNGIFGLVPKTSNCGSRVKRLTKEVLAIVVEMVNSEYLDARAQSALCVYSQIALRCEEDGLPAPSYSWFCKYLKTLDAYKVALVRKGAKVAYQIARRAPYDDDTSTKSEPVRAWELAYIDHTEIDVETIFADTGECIGRPWLTLFIDAYSRRILSYFLSYEPPSYRCVLMVLRCCIQRHNRLPDTISTDGGKEFRSTLVEIAAALLKSNVVTRPPSSPRYGAIIERMLGSTNTMFFHNLVGNTKATKNVRQMTAEIDPSKLAVWTLERLDDKLGDFLYSIYDDLEHREILATPRRCFEQSIERFGERKHRFIPYDDRCALILSATTRKGTVTVTANGVKINYFWFNADLLYPLVGQTLSVRYDPFNLARAWVWVNDKWIIVKSKAHHLLRGMSERMMGLYTTAYRKARGDVEYRRLCDTKLARFFREVHKTEEMLLEAKRHAILLAAMGKSTDEGEQASAQSASQEPTDAEQPRDDDNPVNHNKVNSFALADLPDC